MINFKDEICKIIAENVDGISYEDALSMVEVPTDTKMGDYAFPCFKLAKVLRKAPPLIAKDIAGKLAENQLFEKVEQVNAYVNMFLSKKALVEEAVTTALESRGILRSRWWSPLSEANPTTTR